jgi:hypothetical protein
MAASFLARIGTTAAHRANCPRTVPTDFAVPIYGEIVPYCAKPRREKWNADVQS